MRWVGRGAVLASMLDTRSSGSVAERVPGKLSGSERGRVWQHWEDKGLGGCRRQSKVSVVI